MWSDFRRWLKPLIASLFFADWLLSQVFARILRLEGSRVGKFFWVIMFLTGFANFLKSPFLCLRALGIVVSEQYRLVFCGVIICDPSCVLYWSKTMPLPTGRFACSDSTSTSPSNLDCLLPASI